MMLLLIIGRWLLPRGHLTKDQVSQILFVYLAFAGDILELLEIFQEEQVFKDPILVYGTLLAYTLSLCQFFLILSGRDGDSHQGRNRAQAAAPAAIQLSANGETPKEAKFWNQDVFSVITEMFLQDLPFAIVRISAIVVYKVFQYTLVFFTVKNVLLLCLQLYRLCVLYDEYNKDLVRLDSWIKEKEEVGKAKELKQAKMMQLLNTISTEAKGGQPGRRNSRKR